MRKSCQRAREIGLLSRPRTDEAELRTCCTKPVGNHFGSGSGSDKWNPEYLWGGGRGCRSVTVAAQLHRAIWPKHNAPSRLGLLLHHGNEVAHRKREQRVALGSIAGVTLRIKHHARVLGLEQILLRHVAQPARWTAWMEALDAVQ
jgi:hypothetical protein